MRHPRVVLAVALLGVVAAACTGELDTSFSGDGIVQVNGAASDAAYGAVTQPNGRTLVVGTTGEFGIAVRLRADGSLDPTFDGDGKLTLGGAGTHFSDVARDAHGRYAIVGSTRILGEWFGFVYYVDRLGQPVPGFGIGGWAAFQFQGFDYTQVTSVVIATRNQADPTDDRIYVAGSAGTGAATDVFAVARLTQFGTFDNTFAGVGSRLAAIPGSSASEVHDMARAPDGDLVLAGASEGDDTQFTILRVTAGGAIEMGWGGGDGLVQTVGSGGADGVAVQPDGKVVVVGAEERTNAPERVRIARFHGDGTLDASFGSGGHVESRPGNNAYNEANAVALQGDKIVVAGSTRVSDTTTQELLVARYTATGQLDPSFGGDGWGSVLQGVLSEAFGVALGAGTVTAVGEASLASHNSNLLAVRYLG